ncbi:MAG: Gfo/Idh/MocA family oxidoreductase [Bacteroidia bacterium]
MIKIGVIGVGHLGSIHLRLLKEIPSYEVVGIYDQDPVRAAAMAEEHEVKAWDSMTDLVDACDAVDIVTPTISLSECAKAALKRFKHVHRKAHHPHGGGGQVPATACPRLA